MDASEQIKIFQEFLETNYHAKLLEKIRKGHNTFTIDFLELSKFNPELADLMLDQPEDVIRAAEIAVEQFDLPKPIANFRIRIKNLSQLQEILIREIRSTHIGKFLCVKGTVRQKSDVRPQVTNARFECPSCGNIISVIQLDQKFKEPSRCGCGRKGKFRLLSKKLIDVQRISLEEASEDLEGGEQPKRMNLFLKEDLVSPLSDKKTNPGSKIMINGIIKEVPITLRSGSQSTRFDLLIEANYVEAMQEDFYQIHISKEEEKIILELSKDSKIVKKLITSVAPSIYGYERIKEALLLQLVGGVKKTRSDGVTTRGDMHVLLIGDPGAGKSQLLKRMSKVAPKCRYVSGKGVSGAGLTASVLRDEFLGGWTLEAGALPLSNKGFCMIDEIDKMTTEDRSAMHEALEQQTISISKANVQATLRCETTVLAAANPKFGRFDPYDILAKQIDMPPALINRFDLIFAIKDVPDEAKDKLMAKHILSLHQNPDIGEAEISTELLRKYISYARQKSKPVLTDSALERIKEFYIETRMSGSEEGKITSIPISPRQLEGLVRLAEASAKLRLSDKVMKKDAERAISIMYYCLSQIGIDPETGKIDIDRIASGISASQRGKISIIKEIISELENKLGKVIPIEDVVNECENQDIKRDACEEVIERLKRSGDIFEPKRGFISRI
tara:strand:+ start:26740 stop:28758 length:2019 start_codon:yes stop_codon:yes gene_type:complete